MNEQGITSRPRATRIVNVYRGGYDVYVGSPQSGIKPEEIAPGEYGFLGNPFEDICDPDDRMARYREYFLDRVAEDRRFRLAVLAIRGKRLGCFCEDGQSCHAEVIAEWLEIHRDAHHQLVGKS
jgi:hypothetical protein